jgi:hypothetical protein
LFGIIVIAVAVIGGLASINKAGQLDSTRADYESRRRQLLDAIEAEKRRQN